MAPAKIRRTSGWTLPRPGRAPFGGRYLRLFWQPVANASDLATGKAMPIHVMGEKFTFIPGCVRDPVCSRFPLRPPLDPAFDRLGPR